jgi:hypothetical protein
MAAKVLIVLEIKLDIALNLLDGCLRAFLSPPL